MPPEERPRPAFYALSPGGWRDLVTEWLSRYGALKTAAKLRDKPFLGPTDPQAACEEFIRLCRENGVGNWRERHPFAERAEALRGMFGPPAAPPKPSHPDARN